MIQLNKKSLEEIRLSFALYENGIEDSDIKFVTLKHYLVPKEYCLSEEDILSYEPKIDEIHEIRTEMNVEDKYLFGNFDGSLYSNVKTNGVIVLTVDSNIVTGEEEPRMIISEFIGEE